MTLIPFTPPRRQILHTLAAKNVKKLKRVGILFSLKGFLKIVL
jgi:hypothetical protein